MNKLKTIFWIPSIALIVAFILAACAPATLAPTTSPTQATSAQPTAVATKPLRVALALGGEINDGDWNQAGYEGLVAAEGKYGTRIETSYTEDVGDADMEKALRDYASQGYDLIICHSSTAKEAVTKVAKDYPNIKFLWTDGDTTLPNLAVMRPMTQEASYLAGFLAGKLTKSNVVGLVGSIDIPSTHRGYAGFKLGLHDANPNAKLLVNWTGSFSDIKGAKEATLSQIESGADIIDGNGGSLNVGTIQAADEKGVLAIGAVRDQYNIAPKVVLTSVDWGFTGGFELVIGSALDGSFKGQFYDIGLAQGAVLTPFHGNASKIPADVQEQLKQKTQDILDGKLKVPDVESGS